MKNSVIGKPIVVVLVWLFFSLLVINGLSGCGDKSTLDHPQLSSITPDDGSTGVPLNTNIVAIFEKPMDAGTIEGTSNFALIRIVDDYHVPGEITYNNSTYTAIFNPDDEGLTAETTYQVLLTRDITGADGAPLIQEYTWTFTTGNQNDLTPPTFAGVSSTDGITAIESNSLKLHWDAASDNSTDSGKMVYLIYMAQYSGAQNYQSSSFRTKRGATEYLVTGLVPGTTYYFVVLALDEAGNVSTDIQEVSATTLAEEDTTPPAVTGTRPVEGSVNVSLNTNITVTFSEDMDASINWGEFVELEDSGGTTVVVTVTYNPSTRTVTIDPVSDLTAGTTYTVTLTTGIKDASQNPLEQDLSFSFMTIEDTTPPAVTGTRPVEGSVNVSLNTNITVTFSEDMDASINWGEFVKLEDSGGTTVVVTVTYNPSTRTVTIDPGSDLTAGTTYTVTLTTGIKDASQNPLEQDFYFRFTTGS